MEEISSSSGEIQKKTKKEIDFPKENWIKMEEDIENSENSGKMEKMELIEKPGKSGHRSLGWKKRPSRGEDGWKKATEKRREKIT